MLKIWEHSFSGTREKGSPDEMDKVRAAPNAA